jgi:hypothetical protein
MGDSDQSGFPEKAGATTKPTGRPNPVQQGSRGAVTIMINVLRLGGEIPGPCLQDNLYLKVALRLYLPFPRSYCRSSFSCYLGMDQKALKTSLLLGFTPNIFAFLLGVLAHRLIFAYGEWHLQATTVLKVHFLMWTLIVLAQSSYMISLTALRTSSLLALAYTTGLFGSMTIYRILFHSLREYPGPFLARVTKLWHTMHCLDSKNHLLMERLRRKYGDFVRTGMKGSSSGKSKTDPKIGPNELTVFHPDTLHTIYDGIKNPFSKPAWYDSLRPYTGLNTHRSKYVHDHRRRIWDYAFSTKGDSHPIYKRCSAD